MDVAGVLLAELLERANTDGLAVTRVPLGWRCRHCHATFGVGDLPQQTPYELLITGLIDASRNHRLRCPPTPIP